MIKSNLLKKLKSKRFEFIICVIAASVALFSISFNIGERLYVKTHTETDKAVLGTSQDEPLTMNSEYLIYDNLQNMANDIMYASANNETNFGISTERIQALKVIVSKMGYNDRAYLLSVLDKWEKRNFTSITDEHNYFYLRLKDYKN